MKFDTFKDFFKRFRDAASASEYSGSNRFLIHRDFHSLNVLYDDGDQPYTQEFVDRLFEYFSAKEKLSKNEEYKMDFRTFVNLRRMLHNPKVHNLVSSTLIDDLRLWQRVIFCLNWLIWKETVLSMPMRFDTSITVFCVCTMELTSTMTFRLSSSMSSTYPGLIKLRRQISASTRSKCRYFAVSPCPFFALYSFFRLSFDQLKNHVYGDECLMMLVNYQSAMAFESRFDLPDTNLIDDTIMDEVGEKPVDEEGAKENQKHAEYLVNIFE